MTLKWIPFILADNLTNKDAVLCIFILSNISGRNDWVLCESKNNTPKRFYIPRTVVFWDKDP